MPSLVLVVDGLTWTGPLLWVGQLADGLAARNWSVTIASPRDGPARQHIWRRGVTLLPVRASFLGIPYPRAWGELLDHLPGPVLIHTCDLASHFWTRLYPFFRPRLSYLALYLDNIPDLTCLGPVLRYLHHRDLRIVTHFNCIVRQLCACGLNLRNVVKLPLGIKPITVKPSELTALRAAWELPDGSKLIVAPTTLDERSAVKHLLWAMDILRYVHSELHLIILGAGRASEHWRQFAHQLRLSHHVTFVGAPQDIAPWLAWADLIWLTGEQRSSWFFALVALALGKPIITLEIPHFQELIKHGETGFLSPRADPVALARFTLTCLQTPDLLSYFASNSQRYVTEELNFESCIRAYEDLYHSALVPCTT